MSFLGSIAFLLYYLWILATIGYTTRRHDPEIGTKYQKINALFETLRPTSKSAQVFTGVFLLRRFLYALILVFVGNDYFQVVALVFVSIGYILYLIHARPFEDPKVNTLEIFNEYMVLASCYHLLFFTEASKDVQTKYDAGWSLDLLIIIQLFFNLYLQMLDPLRWTRLFLSRAYRMRKLRKEKAKKHAEQAALPP